MKVFIRPSCVSGTVNTRGIVPALTEPAVHLLSPLVSLPSFLLSPTLEVVPCPIYSSHCPVSWLVPSPWSTSLSISSFASLLTLLWFSGFLIAFFSFLKIVVRTLNMRSTLFTGVQYSVQVTIGMMYSRSSLRTYSSGITGNWCLSNSNFAFPSSFLKGPSVPSLASPLSCACSLKHASPNSLYFYACLLP